MVHTSNKTPRSLAVLTLFKRINAIIAYATGVVQGMTGNPAFPTPVVPLAIVAAAIDDLRNAEAAATMASGTTGVGKVGLPVMPCTTPVAYARMALMRLGKARTARALGVLFDVWTI